MARLGSAGLPPSWRQSPSFREDSLLFLQSHGGRAPTGAGDLLAASVLLVGQKERRTFYTFWYLFCSVRGQKGVGMERHETQTENERKSGGALSPEQLQIFRKQLMARRQALLKNMQNLRREALREVTPEGLGEISSVRFHPADLGSETGEQERQLQVANIEENELIEIDQALYRMENGSYGICQDCEEVIDFKRLNALPHARYCVRCQQMADERETKS
jgi:DnaK suppressor protein